MALGWYDYRLHRGIERYAVEHDWFLSGNYAREKIIPWGWEGDGVLAWLGAGDDLAEFVRSVRKPTVDFSCRRPHLPYPRVLEDHAHAAHLVADHFLSRGITQFIFYSDADNWSYEERGRGFLEAVQRAGHTADWLRWHRSTEYEPGRQEWRRKLKWLATQLKTAPKPVGVFAANDQQALDVLEACESAALAVPESVAIVGAENYLLAPEAMHTPISSVDTNLETLGYRGAALLDSLMQGKPAPTQALRIPAVDVVTRKSSDILAVNHPGVARGLRFLREHSHEAITVADLVSVTAMSRRGLHKAFLEHLGRPPGHELRRLRLSRAKALLRDSGHKIETIAGMCGYQNTNSFTVAFKRALGVSPKHYRDGGV